METNEIIVYSDESGRSPFADWLSALRDQAAVNRIEARFERLALGNFGDAKPVGGGVSELRFHFGPGYRVYFGQYGGRVVVLLIGGDKSTQDRDIIRAKELWQDWLRRAERRR